MTMRLLLLPDAADATAIELTIDGDGGIVARRELPAAAPVPAPASPSEDAHLVIVPGTSVRALWLALPSRQPAQVEAAVRLALEDHVAGDPAQMHLAIDHAADPASPRCVLVVAHARMQAWLARCAALGIRVGTLLPDYLLLPQADEDTVHVAEWMGDTLVRGRRLAFSAEPALARTIIGERPQRQLGEGGAVEALFARAGAAGASPDLLQGAYARRDASPASRRRRLAVLAILALLSPALVSGAIALRHAAAAKMLQSQATELVAARQPHSRPASDPSTAIATLVSRATWPEILAQRVGVLFAAVADSPGTSLDSLSIERGGTLQAGMRHRDAAALDAIRTRIGDAGLDAVVLDSQPVGQQLRSELSVEERR